MVQTHTARQVAEVDGCKDHMKNLMIHISPEKRFKTRPNNNLLETEVQIDNSLRFWKKEDILLVTNFPYEYKGVKAMVVKDDLYCQHHGKASKTNTIIHLIEQGILNDLTWFHDMDAFQLQPMNGTGISREVGFTDYGWSRKWNTGSIFFKPSALKVFRWLRDATYALKTDEERALMAMTEDDTHPINDFYERMNITYNLGMRRIDYNLSIADKPVMVAHFHPGKRDLKEQFRPIIPDYLYQMMKEKF